MKSLTSINEEGWTKIYCEGWWMVTVTRLSITMLLLLHCSAMLCFNLYSILGDPLPSFSNHRYPSWISTGFQESWDSLRNFEVYRWGLWAHSWCQYQNLICRNGGVLNSNQDLQSNSVESVMGKTLYLFLPVVCWLVSMWIYSPQTTIEFKDWVVKRILREKIANNTEDN